MSLFLLTLCTHHACSHPNQQACACVPARDTACARQHVAGDCVETHLAQEACCQVTCVWESPLKYSVRPFSSGHRSQGVNCRIS